jgi:phosphomevalonate kinase
MRARAPGKIVISGAYAVLDGAPALVAAVDRYVIADASQEASFVTAEVRAALGDRTAPAFDATALREGAQKLGLGSSAAILVASLAAIELLREPELGHEELVRRVLPRALVAHRTAQGGGSGVDVAASAHGGVLRAQRQSGELECTQVRLPDGVRIDVLWSGVSASTPRLLAQVAALRAGRPREYERLMQRQFAASEAAANAVVAGDARGLIAALQLQTAALAALGRAAGAAIVTDAVELLAGQAVTSGAAALPAGAGGGDIALWVTSSAGPPPNPEFQALCLEVGAPGVGRADDDRFVGSSATPG